MKELGELRTLNVRDVWEKEATEFTPWLAENIIALGKILGIDDIELVEREARVGEFSLDLLAKDLNSGRHIIIENQFNQTDHDHLGKLITYAAGFDTSTIVWVAEEFRERHRQALDWLNQRTDLNTNFFGVVIEVLQIDDSRPAYNFKVLVSPNEWQKDSRRQITAQTTEKSEKYRKFFQSLIDDLRENHKFTGAKAGQATNWYAFTFGIQDSRLMVRFETNNRIHVSVLLNQAGAESNNELFDILKEQKDLIEAKFGSKLSWDRLDDQQASRIAVYREGSIESTEEELKDIHSWMVSNLISIKEVFVPLLRAALTELR